MQKLPRELVREFFSLRTKEMIDNQTVLAIKKRLAQEFMDISHLYTLLTSGAIPYQI